MDVTHVTGLVDDLVAEQEALDGIVAPLEPSQWAAATPSPRWTVADQIAHLTYSDESAARAITDPSAFAGDVARLAASLAGGAEAADDLTLGEFRQLLPIQLLQRWRGGRLRLANAGRTLGDDSRVGWYGPSMGAKSFLTARLMEVWAHGQDIVDTVGGHRPPTRRLRHIARLGYVTREWSYRNRGLDVPAEPVKVELTAPAGATWTFGSAEATESVTGPAEDFCLVVTQRRHVDDTELTATAVARDWLLKAQAFAGPATAGPVARGRR